MQADNDSAPLKVAEPKPTLLIVGLGKIGLKLALNLKEDFSTYGIKKSAVSGNIDPSIQILQEDLLDLSSLKQNLPDKLPKQLDYVVFCLTPAMRNEDAYRAIYIEAVQNLLDALPDTKVLRHAFFVSSTSVYHQNDKSWVDEDSLCRPTSYSGKVLLEAEKRLSERIESSSVVRFSGIYGGSRNQLISKVETASETGDAILSRHERLTNRIHEDDCVGFLAHLLKAHLIGKALEPCYLASDGCPVDLNEVILHISHTRAWPINLDRIDIDTRRGGNKKCSNKKMLETGYELAYPSYKVGY